MSNIAVNTCAMQAVVIGTGSLKEFGQPGVAIRADRSWARPTPRKRGSWRTMGEIARRADDVRSARAADNRRRGIASPAVLARV